MHNTLATLIILLTLSGCGFQPMLERSATPTPLTLTVTGLEGYLNHIFYLELKQHLNLLSSKTPVTVKVTLDQTVYDISYGRDATALRSQNVMVASYEIWQQGKILRKGKVDSITSYNLDRNDEFASLTSRMGSDHKIVKAITLDVAREVFLALS